MKNKVIAIMCAFSVGIASHAIAKGKTDKKCENPKKEIKVELKSRIDYRCKGGTVKVAYYNLSDRSLEFAKITLPSEMDGVELTLARVITASGFEYTNGSFSWKGKGDTATLDVPVEDGRKETKYRCKRVQTELAGTQKP